MTNEEFLEKIKDALNPRLYPHYDHAVKLIAVVEEAKEIGHERDCNAQLIGDCECGYYDLKKALEKLEQE